MDGQTVEQDGAPVHIDLQAAHASLAQVQARTLATARERDWAGRGAEQTSLLVFEVRHPPGPGCRARDCLAAASGHPAVGRRRP